MSVRRVMCPKCNGTRKTVVTEHNPETTDMNMRVTLRCDSPLCEHEWEGRVMSHHTQARRGRGLRV